MTTRTHTRSDTRGGPRALAALLATAGLMVGASLAPRDADAETRQLLAPSSDRGTIQLTAASGADAVRTIDLEVGRSVLIRTDFAVKRVSVGDPGVADVVVLGQRDLQLVAKHAGSTNVLLWDTAGRAQSVVDVHVGTAYSHLERDLNRILGVEEIRVEGAGNGLVLTGNVPSAEAAESAVAIAHAFVGEKSETDVVNLLEVGGRHQVMLKVVVAEMSRTLIREFGTNVNAIISSGGETVTVNTLIGGLTSLSDSGVLLSDMVNLAAGFSGFGALELLEVFLDALDERGLGKVLAEPTLVARSGESASFLAGGEVAIPVAQGGAFGSITVEYHNFGVALNFTPTVLAPDRIHLEVFPEVSQPDFTLGSEVEGTIVPGFRTRRVSTNVELADGESFMVAGLLNEAVREVSSKYPILGNIPVLGALFRSSQFQHEETELVILVTPYLVKPLGPGPHPLPTDAFVEPNAFEFYLLGRMEGSASDAPARAGATGAATGGVIGDVGHRISTVPEGGEK